MELLQLLEKPPRMFSPMPFWFLNDTLEPEEMRRQLRDFEAHGVYGVVLHPRIGMDSDLHYLSDAFFDKIGVAIEEAERLHMSVILYDEGMYPSGSASGQVVEGHPELRSRGIAWVQTPTLDDTILYQDAEGCLVERFSGGTIRGIHFGEDDGEANAPLSADILNPQAVERFLNLTHEQYYARFSQYFGNTVIGFFTDEPSILGRNAQGLQPWTLGFAVLFEEAGGKLEGLKGLFTGKENEDTQRYRRLILQRESEVYYAKLSGWCEQHGIALMGHPHQSDDIEVEQYFHVPGQDLVFRWVSPETGDTNGMDSTMAKCSADAARLMHRTRNSNECFGACNRENNPWYFTGDDMKWMIDYLCVRGVNLLIPHAFYYSLRGTRSAERPPDVGPGSIWWSYYTIWSTYIARLCCLMTDCEMHADIAVPCTNRNLHPELVASLFTSQRGFQYLPESVWKQCREENGMLCLGERRFQAVLGERQWFPAVSHEALSVAPDIRIDPPHTMLRVARFKRSGTFCYLLVNAGEETIAGEVTFPEGNFLGAYDLFHGKVWRFHATMTEQGMKGEIRLPRRESLLIFACSQADWEQLPERKTDLHMLTPEFTLASEDTAHFQKTYQAEVICDDVEDMSVKVCADEMAVLYWNDQEAGVSFWSPHIFEIPSYMVRSGVNVLRLQVTGNRANQYGTAPVAYGLHSSGGD